MATTGPGPPTLPLPRPRFFTGKRLLLYLVLIGLSCVALSWLATYLIGERGTAELTACNSGGRGGKGCSVVYITDAGERGTDHHVAVRHSDEPGDSIPIKVRNGEVLDARFGANDLVVLGPMVMVVLSTTVCLTVPPALAVLRSFRRDRAERELRARGESVWWVTSHDDGAPTDVGPVEASRVTQDDGTPYASARASHPGPAYPPSAVSFDVGGADGRPRYTVRFRTPDPRRSEIAVYTPDGAVRAVIRRRLVDEGYADIHLCQNPGGTPDATIRPSDRLGVEREIVLPNGARAGTLLALPTAPGPTLLGLRSGVPEALLDAVVGLALARERFYPRPWLERADRRWEESNGQLGTNR